MPDTQSAPAAAGAPPTAAPALPWAAVAAWREHRARRRPDLRLRTEEDARAFVDEVGLCFLFTAPGTALPTLWEAINGGRRDIPGHHHDAALGKCWEWKDTLPARKVVWYGKLLRGKPMFVSLDLLPAFYALSENYGDLLDYREQYADGRMSQEARDVYEALLEFGPQSTNALRRRVGLYGKGDPARRFDRAVAELQQDLKIVKSGTSEDNRWKYCYVYDLLLRWHPPVAEQARALSTREARRRLVARYLENAGAVPVAAIGALFGWDAALVERAVADLVGDEGLRRVEVTDAAGRRAASGAAQERRARGYARGRLAGANRLTPLDQGVVAGALVGAPPELAGVVAPAGALVGAAPVGAVVGAAPEPAPVAGVEQARLRGARRGGARRGAGEAGQQGQRLLGLRAVRRALDDLAGVVLRRLRVRRVLAQRHARQAQHRVEVGRIRR